MTLGDSSPSRLNGIQAGVRDLDIGDVQGDDVTVAAPPKSTVEDEWKPDEEDKENENGKRDDNGVENESGDAPEVSNQQLGEEAPKKKKKRKKKSKGSRKFVCILFYPKLFIAFTQSLAFNNSLTICFLCCWVASPNRI